MTPVTFCFFAEAQVDPLEFYKFYAANLRTGLFSGFLTLSGFLLAMKTLVVIQLRKELYDTKFYRSRVVKRRELNKSLSVYGPLRRFGRLLLVAIILSIATSLSQFSVGLIERHWAAVACLCLGGVTALVLLTALAVLWVNLGDMFKLWEDEAEDKIKLEAAEKAVPKK